MDDVRLVRRVGLVCGLIVLSSGAVLADGRVSFSVDSWAEKWGNHRVRLQVDQAHDAVRAHVPWRRRDPAPQTRGIAILHADSGKPVTNVAAITIAREHGDIVFQPAQGSGRYDLYTMPYTASKVPHQFATRYKKPGSKADPAWLKKHSLTPDRLPHGKWKNLPATTVLEIQARSERDRFDPMEVIATAEETDALLARHKDSSYLLFPEDRSRPIRMTDDLPLCWIDRGPSNAFRGQAKRGEFYTFQIGVFAAAKPIQNLTVTMSDLRSEAGAAIPASRLRCFNAGGTDWLGRPIRKTISVAKGKVQPLWFGLDVPPDAPVGTYRGSVTLRPERGNETNVSLSLTVSADVLADAGDSDPHRLARLRWLDSTVGLDDKVVAPFTPMVVKGQTVRCLGRRVQIADTGLPAGIQSLFAENVDRITDQGLELLAGPMAMIVETAGGKIAWTGQEPIIVSKATGAVVWESTSRGGGLTMRCRAKMEADGYANYRVTLRADQATNVNDIRLEIPLRRQVATYMMGMGCKGGHRPEKWDWKWDVNRANNSLWIGAVNAGLHCKLKGPRDTWNLYNLADGGVPQSWDNNGRGRCTVRQENPDTVVIRASTGQRTLQAGQQLAFRFGLLITPIKPLNPDHWNQRYYHAYVPVKTVQKAGAKIVNIHHGNELNPFINYPFLTTEKLKAYVDNAHANDIKVKIYYTVRELSNYVAELWPLRSLGREIFADGAGGGHAWLHEHLVTHYAPAWHHVLPDGQVDASIATVGLSRWHNYYLEGLAWLVRNVGIDGLYLDGIGYDREIMKRVRKVLDRNRPGCLIDFHSGNNFHPTYGLSNCANQYMEHLPYIDSLWFGEGYDYNESPDYWLVEISGIPFGLFGEMLQGGGNSWRGMIFGMTGRYYQGADPGRIWKIWDEFGIQDARMHGYWSPNRPVKTDHKDVLLTAYCKPGKTLLSLASWAPRLQRIRLTIDWKALGLNPAKAKLYAPPIKGFQPAALFKPTDAIPVPPGRGWLLMLDESDRDIPAIPAGPDSHTGRKKLLEQQFTEPQLDRPWTTHLSKRTGTRLTPTKDGLTIQSAANSSAFIERTLPPKTGLIECRIDSGTDGGASWGPGLCVVWPNRIVRINFRAEGRFGVDDGNAQFFGGFVGPESSYRLRIRIQPDKVFAEACTDQQPWETIHAFPRTAYLGQPTTVRIGKMSPGGKREDHHIPGPTGTCTIKALQIFGPQR